MSATAAFPEPVITSSTTSARRFVSAQSIMPVLTAVVVVKLFRCVPYLDTVHLLRACGPLRCSPPCIWIKLLIEDSVTDDRPAPLAPLLESVDGTLEAA